MRTIPEINFTEIAGVDGNLGLITLTRQQALNALNHEMFLALDDQLTEWEQKKTIKAVIITAAEGRAFSAGGDIRSAYERKLANDPTLSHFFRDEYRMNSRIHHFPKPYIALLDGITMGGGVGVSLHGSHRIATERLVFSMPETGIGFYPDVGTTYFLSRFPHKMGFYLALTGVRIPYTDCYMLGIVQEVVAHAALPTIIAKLAENKLPDKNSVTEVLRAFSITPPASTLLQHKEDIELCFGKNSVEEILSTLEAQPSEWCQETAKIIKTKSPTSLKITLLALQKAQKLNFDECIKMEYGLTCHFIQSNDFFEGIRAAIIDKDQKPHWQPSKLADVTAQEVEKYFTPLTQEIV